MTDANTIKVTYPENTSHIVLVTYFYEHRVCSVSIEEKRTEGEDYRQNKHNEFYVSYLNLTKGKDVSLTPYPETLLISGHSEKNNEASIEIKCTGKDLTLSSSISDIEELLRGVVSFIDP